MQCSVYVLTCMTFGLGAVTISALALAVSTDSWLLTKEQFVPRHENGSRIEGMAKMWMTSWSGLWKVCVGYEAVNVTGYVSCMPVSTDDTGESGRENNAETTMVIVSAVRRAVPLPVTSLILGTVAVIFSVMGSIHSDVKTLVGAVFFVLSGLALAVGIILYISAINDEVGYRMRTKRDEDGFRYTYGWSFFSAGIGFLASEMAAVVSVTLYLKRNSSVGDMVQIIPGLEDKVDSDLLNREDGIHNPTIIL